jgi:undecaprenyl-diphosphatase
MSIASLDLWLFQLLNGLAGNTPLVDQLMQALVSDYVGPTVQVLGMLGIWFEGHSADQRRTHQRAVLRAVVALALSGALVGLSNLFYYRDRPFRYHDVNLLFYYPTDSSFPSNSVAVVFSFATCIWLENRKWGWPLVALATGFAVSRVYCGVHYPLDVLGGCALGAGAALFLTRYAGWLNQFFDLFIALMRSLYLA